MKLEKKQINDLLIRWIKSDANLWGELSELQIKILFERIVHEISYRELAEKYKTNIKMIHQTLMVIFFKIEKAIGKAVSDLLRQINDSLNSNSKSPKIFQVIIGEVFLN